MSLFYPQTILCPGPSPRGRRGRFSKASKGHDVSLAGLLAHPPFQQPSHSESLKQWQHHAERVPFSNKKRAGLQRRARSRFSRDSLLSLIGTNTCLCETAGHCQGKTQCLNDAFACDIQISLGVLNGKNCIRRQRKRFQIQGAQVPRNEAYGLYVAVTRDAAQRRS
jgi:hypothetical protein